MFQETRDALQAALADGPNPISVQVYVDYPEELILAPMAVVCRPVGTSSLVLGHGQRFSSWRLAVDVALMIPGDVPGAAEQVEDLIEYMLAFVSKSDYGLLSVDPIATGEYKGALFTHTRVHLACQSKL